MAVAGSILKVDWLRDLAVMIIILGVSIFVMGVVNTGANWGSGNVYTLISVGIWGAIPIILTGAFALWMSQNPCSENDYYTTILSLSTIVFAPIIIIVSSLEILKAVEISETRFILPSGIAALGLIELLLLATCMLSLCRQPKSADTSCECTSAVAPGELEFLNIPHAYHVGSSPPFLAVFPNATNAQQHQIAIAAGGKCPACQLGNHGDGVSMSRPRQIAEYITTYPIFNKNISEGHAYGNLPHLYVAHASH